MQKKTLVLLAIGATAILAGAAPVAARSRLGFLVATQTPGLLAWVLMYVWYKADVAQRRLSTSTEFNGFVIFLSLVALPVYFFRSRGAGRGLLSAAIFYLFILAWLIVVACAAAIAATVASSGP